MKYALPGISTFITLTVWLSQQWLTQHFNSKYANLPWIWLFVVSLFFLIGVIYSDLFNEQSNFREWLKSKQKIFIVDHFVLGSKFQDNEYYYQAICGLQFVTRIKNVRLSIQVTQYASIDHAVSKFILTQDKFDLVEDNLCKKYRIATFPRRVSNEIPVGSPYWGENKDKSWAGDGKHIVTIKAHSFLRSQTKHFLIAAIKNFDGGPEPVLLLGDEDTERFLTINELP